MSDSSVLYVLDAKFEIALYESKKGEFPMKRKFMPLGALLILVLVTLACGGSEPTETPASPPTEAPVLPTDTPVPPTETPEPPTPTPEPEPVVEPGWYIYSNGNYVREIALAGGTLWAATGGGVVAWDLASGESFKYTVLDGLPTNDVEAIAVCPMPEPVVFAGTEHGLSIYDPDTDAWDLTTPDNSEMEGTSIDALDCDYDGHALMIGYTWGLNIYSADTDEWLFLDEDDGLVTDWVSQAAVIGDDLWIVSSFGVSTVHADGSVSPYDEDLTNIPDENVSAVAGDADGNVWLAAFDGLLKFRDGAWTLYNSDNVTEFPYLDAFTGVVVASDGTVWVGNTFGDICQFDPVAETCLTIYEGEPGMVGGLYDMIIDDQDRIYYCDDGEGISMFEGGSWETFVLDELPVGNRYEAITQIDEYVYVGGSFGLQIFPAYEDAGEWVLNDVEGYTVNTFHHTSEGVWMGHGAGASFYDYESGDWINYRKADEAGAGIYDGGARAITVDGSGRVWFGTYNGLTVWDGETYTYYDLLNEEEIAEEQSPRSVNALLFDGANVWVGAYGALFRFDENDEMTRWDEELPGLLSFFTPSAQALALDRDGNVLLAIGNRLLEYDVESETFSQVMEASSIYSILTTDEGEIWLGLGYDGVAYYDGSAWSLLTTLDGYGLPSNHFSGQSILVDDAGTIWFAGDDGGLARYVP
jgi:ligand-binding sensor domain-containing protein